MKKPVKYLWLALGGIAALLAAGILVFALTFDPNRYKDDIQRMAMERTGRTLRLQGELKLVFFPSLGAGVGGVTLSERGSQREFISLQSARASVKLMPLLRGQVIVDTVRRSGFRAQLVKNKDGSYNFSDLLEGKAEKPVSKSKQQSAPVRFDIAGVDIDRAAVAYRDTGTGQEISLSDLQLHTGRIAGNAQGKIEFADLDFTARLDESSIKGKLAMARTAQPSYRFDLDIDRINLDHYLAAGENKPDAAVDLSGLKGLNAQGQLQIGALQVQGLKISRLKAKLQPAGARAEISPHSASLYGGELSGALSLDGNANRIALKEDSVERVDRPAAQGRRAPGSPGRKGQRGARACRGRSDGGRDEAIAFRRRESAPARRRDQGHRHCRTAAQSARRGRQAVGAGG